VDSVPIIGGTGAIGFALGARLAQAGVQVVIGSRDAGRAEEAAGRIGENARGLVNAEAATRGPALIMCVPFRSHSETLTNLKQVLQPGQTLIDATVPLAAAVSGKATRMLGVPQGSAAQQAQEMVPEGVDVVAAFHTLSAPVMGDLERELDEDVLIAGDRKEAKARAAEIVRHIPGLRPVDAGRLEQARHIESITPLLISVNVRNKTHAGIKLTGIEEPRW
jgi:8-hydroxy-5-deazaflavin:NADPH oxidoreductase